MSVLILLAFLAVCLGESKDWSEFKAIHGRNFKDPAEEIYRKRIFYNNLGRVLEHNRRFQRGLTKFEMEINKFGDWTEDELVGPVRSLLVEKPQSSRNSMAELPDEFDWREKGAVSPVRDQKLCGASWAFSAVGALEGANFLKTGKLDVLSVQHLLDCSSHFANFGCRGGSPEKAYNFLIFNKGIALEKDYPYQAIAGECQKNFSVVGKVRSVTKVQANEESLKDAVANVGPISVCIYSTYHLRFYKKGIFDDGTCRNTKVNLCALAVGYGTEGGEDYWTLKNSWGEEWGEGGYVRMSRNKGDPCGIATIPVYPEI